jgi:hypothetical protein
VELEKSFNFSCLLKATDTLARFDLTTHSSSLLDWRCLIWRQRFQGKKYFFLRYKNALAY